MFRIALCWMAGWAAVLYPACAFAEAGASNLLSNSSFEQEAASSWNHATHWTRGQPDDHGGIYGSASREKWHARTGEFTAAIRGRWAHAGENGGWWQEVPGQTGRLYRLRVWFRADREWSARTQVMKLEFWNQDRTQVLHREIASLKPALPAWAARGLEAKAPAETGWVRSVMEATGVGPAGSLEIDDVALHGAEADP